MSLYPGLDYDLVLLGQEGWYDEDYEVPSDLLPHEIREGMDPDEDYESLDELIGTVTP